MLTFFFGAGYRCREESERVKRAFLRTARIAISSSLICASAAPLWGWKVVTHAHLAFIARADALDDGKVTIHLVDHDAGRPVLDAAGRPVEIGRYDVDPRILRVLRLHPRQRARLRVRPTRPEDFAAVRELQRAKIARALKGEDGGGINVNFDVRR